MLCLCHMLLYHYNIKSLFLIFFFFPHLDILEITKPFSVLQDLPEAHRGEIYNGLFEILHNGQMVAQLQAVVRLADSLFHLYNKYVF